MEHPNASAPTGERRFLDTRSAAGYLGLSPRTLERLRWAGGGHAFESTWLESCTTCASSIAGARRKSALPPATLASQPRTSGSQGSPRWQRSNASSQRFLRPVRAVRDTGSGRAPRTKTVTCRLSSDQASLGNGLCLLC